MKLAHRVSLDGVQLDSLDPRIIIRGIEGGAGRETVTVAATGAGDGTRITGMRRESVELAVRIAMNISARRTSAFSAELIDISGGMIGSAEANGMEERGRVLEEINAWAARGGVLRISYKPNRRLNVDEVVLPGEGDLWRRLSEYTITFRAHAIPYWEENTATVAETSTGQNRSGSILIAGSAKTVLDAELINQSGATINTASITIGGKTMSFTSLGLGGGETLKIDHVITRGKNVVRIRIGSKSVLAKRSEDSADEFEALPGDCAFSFTAQRACRLRVSCRGRFA